jgi:hypothetical protein
MTHKQPRLLPLSDCRCRNCQGFTGHSGRLLPANATAIGPHSPVFDQVLARGCLAGRGSLVARSASIRGEAWETVAVEGRFRNLASTAFDDTGDYQSP